MLLLIDNYDSFTYNLVHYFQILHQDVAVYHHDAISIEDIQAIKPDHLVISPGPKAPDDAGISLAVIEQLHQDFPILGVCLGHQCLAQAFGGSIIQAPEVIHGKTSPVSHYQRHLFSGIPTPFNATRYHSLTVDPKTLPECFMIDAWVDNTIMAITHRHLPLYGLQFHPEAILTEHGLKLLENFIHHEQKTTL